MFQPTQWLKTLNQGSLSKSGSCLNMAAQFYLLVTVVGISQTNLCLHYSIPPYLLIQGHEYNKQKVHKHFSPSEKGLFVSPALDREGLMNGLGELFAHPVPKASSLFLFLEVFSAPNSSHMHNAPDQKGVLTGERFVQDNIPLFDCISHLIFFTRNFQL